MNVKKAMAMACCCPEGSHLPGCELRLWQKVKYGDREHGIKGIAELSGAAGYLSDKAVESCEQWYEKLHDSWVSEKRMHLKREECGWIAEWTV